MQYTTLGKTGYKVSRLGFGAMRLPMIDKKVDRKLAIPMFHKAFQGGVNFVDTAVMYCSDDSQYAVGEAIKGWRDKLVISTKNHYYGENEKEWWQNLENSLKRLQIDSIDIYNTHGINAKSLEESVKPRIINWLRKAKDQGLIRNICTSFHDTPEGLKKVADSGLFGSIILQYNIINRQLEDMMAYAHSKGIGIIVMGPVGGGKFGATSPELEKLIPRVKRLPELAMRFVLSNPNVDIALSGMSTIQQVEENIKIASDTSVLKQDEIKLINEHIQRLSKRKDLNCTGCAYCEPCPKNVNISRIFDYYNTARCYDMWQFSKQAYSELKEHAGLCVECGVCLPKCPQKIDIPKELKRCDSALRTK